MYARIIASIFLVLATWSLWFFGSSFPEYHSPELVRSLVAVTVTYAIFQLLFRRIINKRIKERKIKHLFRRLNNAIFYLVLVLWLLTIWVENTETLLLSYGLFSAAIALALQDVFKNLIGGFVLLANNNYRVGDRIEIDGLVGDVIKIDLLYTTVLEIQNWVDGDQPTGRLSFVPNAKMNEETIYNYTKDHQFIWDEIIIPITYESDWQKAASIIKNELDKKQLDIDESVQAEIETLSAKYFLEAKPTEPNIFIKITDNWVELHARYITNTLNRRTTKSELNEQILIQLQGTSNVKIASETLQIFQ